MAAQVFNGSGDPNGVVIANPGDFYQDDAGKVWVNVAAPSTWSEISTGSGGGAFVFNSNGLGGAQQDNGTGNVATGANSFAAGQGSDARGTGSHAEGTSFVAASGTRAHAEGQSNAYGADAHAEGFNTFANADRSHAEGARSAADGVASHAEGADTTATGENSHAEGTGSRSIGAASHAEGNGSQASGAYAHAEGGMTVASGEGSHAEGDGTGAVGAWSHAQGSASRAARQTQFAQASGDDGGFGTQAGAAQMSRLVFRGNNLAIAAGTPFPLRYGLVPSSGFPYLDLEDLRSYDIRLTLIANGKQAVPVYSTRTIKQTFNARCVGGIATITGVGAAEDYGDVAAAGWTLTPSVSGADRNITFTFTPGGADTHTIMVEMMVEFNEVRFAA